MFKLAVVGPIVAGGFGVARHCLTCERWNASYHGMPCFGFGPGCIEYRPRSRDGHNACGQPEDLERYPR